MEKLKILLIMLVSATGGLAVSGYILALVLTPTESALEVLSQLLTKGFPATFPFLVLFSSLLFLSTVVASVVGVIYFLVLPEMKTYYAPGNGNGRKNTAVVLKTLKPEERSIVNVLDAHGGTYLQKYIAREAGLSRLKTHRVVARCRSAESSRLRSTETRTRLSLRSGSMTVCINHETFPSDRYEALRAGYFSLPLGRP